MSIFQSRIAFALLACALCGGVCFADDTAAPATQPAPNRGGNAGVDPVLFLVRLQARLDAIQLSDAQKSRLQGYLDTDQQQAQILKTEIQDLRPGLRMQRVAVFMRQVREQLVEVLSPEQLLAIRPSAAGALGGAATQPAAGDRLEFFQRFKTALDQLDLSDAQKTQIAGLMNQMRAKLQEIRQNPADRGQLRDAVTNFRDQIIQILTPDQRQALRQQLAALAPATESPAASSTNTTATVVDSTPSMMANDDPSHSSQKTSSAPASPSPLKTDSAAVTSAVAGSPAPPFHLLTPGNADLRLSSFKGRVLIIEFGSITSPTFRDHVADMEHLRQQYNNRASFLLVYTREQHPGGGWESARNEQDGISVPQPPDLHARQAEATQARQSLRITLPIGVDDMDDAVTSAYGGFPNATVVIGRDGTILARQQWTDPSGLPRIIDAALAAK